MKRNIAILYVLASLGNAWVWLATWAFYYLIYTGYTGIGIIEMITFLTVTLLEIPSGAIADKYGKVKTMKCGYFLAGSGNIIVAFARGFEVIVIGVVVIMAGIAFLSGSYQALTYDSLKYLKQENNYEKIYSQQKVIHMTTFVLAALLGGYVYTAWFPGAPFMLTGIFYFLALIVSAWLLEPKQSTNKVEVGFLAQNL